MNNKTTIIILLLLTFNSCAIFSPDSYYTPKSSNDFYFPSLSETFKAKEKDCIKKEEYPCNFSEPNDTLSNSVNQWYSKHLKSMKEPILHKLQNEDKKIIRFTHLGTWSSPFSYRIENNNEQITLTYNKTKELGGYNAGRRIKHNQKIIKLETWENIMAKIDSMNFWSIETHDPNMILDGAEWILEVLIDDKYHFVTRTSPENYGGEKYAELCKLVINAD